MADPNTTEPCVPAPEDIVREGEQEPGLDGFSQSAAAAAAPAEGRADNSNDDNTAADEGVIGCRHVQYMNGAAPSAVAAAAAAPAASAAASPAPHRISPREPQEPLDRSVPGPPLTCHSFVYADAGDPTVQNFLLCPVSKLPLFDPVQCMDGHFNCRSCLTSAGGKCAEPGCHDASGVQSDIGVQFKSLLNRLQVLCPDCGERMAREQQLHHRNNLCRLPCERDCDSTVTRADAAAHEPVCPRRAACEAAEFGCDWRGDSDEQAAHHAVCKLNGVLPAFRLMDRRLAAQQTTTQQLQEQVAQQQETIAAQVERIAQQQADIVALRATTAQCELAHTALATRLGALALLIAGEPLTNVVLGMRDLQPGSALVVRVLDTSAQLARLEAQLARHTARLRWRTLGDDFCTQNGVVLAQGWNLDHSSFRFAQDTHGSVHLEGMLWGGEADMDMLVLTLPVGYRPARIQCRPIDGGLQFGEVLIKPSGDLTVRLRSPNTDWVSVDGVSFCTV